jgi:two-component system OmpR family response regulator
MVNECACSILVVDDHEEVRDSLHDYLRHSGFDVLTAANAGEARAATARNNISLVVLDIMMPGEDGISLCRHLREVQSTPVIFLTAKNEETDRIVGLEAGADDYVVKPFNPRELIARIRAILRRLHEAPPQPTPIDSGTIRFDHWNLQRRGKRLVSSCGAHEHELTGAEYQLLMVFLRHPRRVLARDELLEMTAGRQGRPFDRTIDNQVRRLRKKVEQEPSRPRVIRTVWGRGYCLDVEVERQAG